jgi:chromosome partitioning protein
MAVKLAVANRKGGVGKSTIATMLAHTFSVWGRYRVLLVDLDSQANSSLILMGGNQWAQARIEERTAADYLFDRFSSDRTDAEKYIFAEGGDLLDEEGYLPSLSLIPGSLEMENYERDLLHELSGSSTDLARIGETIKNRVNRRLDQAGFNFDLLIIDCPPGVSFAMEAAIASADKVIVPFRPDYVSLFAVDRIGRMIEDAPTPRALQEIPKQQRRYAALANLCQNKASHQRLIDDISAFHPVLQTLFPQSSAVANSFDWERQRKSIEKKYGASLPLVRGLFSEVLAMVKAIESKRGELRQWDRAKRYAKPAV